MRFSWLHRHLAVGSRHWWEHNKNKGIIVALLAIPVAGYLATQFGAEYHHSGNDLLLHAGQEYVSFLCLLGSLFIISGGIYIQGSLSGTPLVNTAMLAIEQCWQV